ncbi:MAG: tRNA (adenosine(37)-N6)-threonylcarbamoyltransferase complex dimerization subunit type 1 TsaB [Betaproteobacteria bacterium]|nr:MAG: tRNA (adenosine(37)-N6)-threonylcarbamoyltransferase complex dimerization subunit type 1 TsaB [Betaproteobacteria bacterium]
MILLALETATEWCSAALWLDGELRLQEAHAGNRHSELLLPMAQHLLAEAGLRYVDLDAIAYGAGPGSFTGLRIACGVTQGLALAVGCPVIGVGSLHALAAAVPVQPSTEVLALLDARMGEVYVARYRGGVEMAAPAVLKPGLVPPPTAGAYIAGTGFAAYEAELRAAWAACSDGADHDYTLSDVRYPSAAQIAHLAAPRLAAGEGRPAETAEPIYVRNKVALKKGEHG